MTINVTPIPRLTALTTPAFTLGTANAAGDALTAIASNSTLLTYDTTAPTTVGASDTPGTGSAAVSARRDHVHGSAAFATDYATGTFIPTVHDGDLSDKSQAYNIQLGRYTRVGNLVYINLNVRLTSLGSLTASSGAFIMGLPFTSVNTASQRTPFYPGACAGLAITAGESLIGQMENNSAYMGLYLWDGTAGVSSLLVSEVSASGQIILSGSYQV